MAQLHIDEMFGVKTSQMSLRLALHAFLLPNVNKLPKGRRATLFVFVAVNTRIFPFSSNHSVYRKCTGSEKPPHESKFEKKLDVCASASLRSFTVRRLIARTDSHKRPMRP